MKRISILFLCAIPVLLAACSLAGLQANATVTPAAALAATQTALPPTITPPAPTASPAPTYTPGPTNLNPAGPYVMYGGDDGIWISNPDGSFVTKLIAPGLEWLPDLHRLVSPKGDRLAVMVRNDEGLDLVEVKIPSGETKTITHLLNITLEELFEHPTSERSILDYTLVNFDNIAWQPGEGRLLAFMGAIDGPTVDLYTYDTQTGEITQLTNGASQGIFPTWSPDGKYILHYGVSWQGPFENGVLPVLPHLSGVWAVRAADGEVITQPKPKGDYFSFVDWQDEAHYITYDNNETCSQNLRSVDVVTGQTTPISDLSFSSIVRSPKNGAFLFTADVFSGSTSGCANSPGSGTYLLLPGETKPIRVDPKALEMEWIPESKVFSAFQLNSPTPVTLYSPDGKTQYEVPVRFTSYGAAISQKGYQAWKAIENKKDRVKVRIPGADWTTIAFDKSIASLIWDPVSGDTLLIIADDGTVYAAVYPYKTAHRTGTVGQHLQVIWVP